MKRIYDSLKGLIDHEMIKKVAKTVDETPEKVTDASHAIIAGLLGMMLKKGVTPQMREIFEEAGNLEILSDIENICQEKLTKDQLRIGDNFLQHLLGDYAADFSDPIAHYAKISNVATNRLVTMIAPIVAGFFGNRMNKDNWSLHQILHEIDEQKSNFRDKIPAALVEVFDLYTILHSVVKNDSKPVQAKKKRSWIAWFVLILLILLCVLLWKTCSKEKMETTTSKETVVTEQTITTNNNSDTRKQIDLKLSDGTVIKVNKGGVEERMVDFLQSDKYKNATEKDLQNEWFEFDDIDFKFNNGVELESGSMQLDNIAAILKSFKNAKIKVGANADKVGSDEASLRISEKRAKTIESLLEKRGVGSQVVRTEGYGNEYAKVPASASEEARSKDRDIALRFVK